MVRGGSNSKNSQTQAYLRGMNSMDIVEEEQYGKTTRDSLKAPFSNKKQKPQTARARMNVGHLNAKLSNYQITSNIYSGNKYMSDIKAQVRPVTSSNTGSSNFRLHKGPLKIVSENDSGAGIHDSVEKEPTQPTVIMFSNIDDEIETEFEMYQKDRSPLGENSIPNTNKIEDYHSTITGVSPTREQPKETVFNKTDGAKETSDIFLAKKVNIGSKKTISKGSEDEGTFQEAVFSNPTGESNILIMNDRHSRPFSGNKNLGQHELYTGSNSRSSNSFLKKGMQPVNIETDKQRERIFRDYQIQ